MYIFISYLNVTYLELFIYFNDDLLLFFTMTRGLLWRVFSNLFWLGLLRNHSEYLSNRVATWTLNNIVTIRYINQT